MYTYSVKMEPQRIDIKIDFSCYQAIIEDSVKDFNETPKKNVKIISDMVITTSYLTLTLTSEAPLESVGRALRSFTAIILEKEKELISFCTPGGSLFRYTLIKEENEIFKEDSAEKISDAQLINALVDYVCANRDTNSTVYKKKRMAIEEMKKITKTAGIIKQRCLMARIYEVFAIVKPDLKNGTEKISSAHSRLHGI